MDNLYDPSIERRVLNSAIQNDIARDAALKSLTPECFYNKDHAQVFIAIDKLHSQGAPVDPDTVAKIVKNVDDPILLLSEITDLVASNVDISFFVKRLNELQHKRKLLTLSHNLKSACDNGELTSETIINDLQNEIGSLYINENTNLPSVIWSSHYNEKGIPDRKPELISGILRRSHKMIIGAPSKACKSFLAIRLSLSIAHGKEFLNFPCTKGAVYLVNFEIDEGSYIHRVKAVADALGWAIPGNIAFHHLRGYSRDIEKLLPDVARSIENTKAEFSAIILDPQYKLLRSEKIRNFSENDTAHMAYLYSEFDRYFSMKNISTITISHFAKGNASFKEAIDRIAGSGAPMRDVDAICTMSSLEVDDSYRMEFSLREFKAPEPLSLRWEYPLHHLDNMLDSVPLKRPGRPSAATGNDDELVLKTVTDLDGKANQSNIRAALARQIGKERVINSLQRLKISGKLSSTKGEKNAIYYHVV